VLPKPSEKKGGGCGKEEKGILGVVEGDGCLRLEPTFFWLHDLERKGGNLLRKKKWVYAGEKGAHYASIRENREKSRLWPWLFLWLGREKGEGEGAAVSWGGEDINSLPVEKGKKKTGDGDAFQGRIRRVRRCVF